MICCEQPPRARFDIIIIIIILNICLCARPRARARIMEGTSYYLFPAPTNEIFPRSDPKTNTNGPTDNDDSFRSNTDGRPYRFHYSRGKDYNACWALRNYHVIIRRTVVTFIDARLSIVPKSYCFRCDRRIARFFIRGRRLTLSLAVSPFYSLAGKTFRVSICLQN